ncbi:hypothetical protein PHMEG_00014250 [Phytophthora megakarya]|uniref:HAT C-terminal dimerisation domain-containing protein n=1 Tax=Phytophthora megakarya TaxID=4795 RepID=A0A225W4R0_9STRA|nr:hypothetical protein PHMEG_00014250 [Phytophthora megakarya]
MLTSSHPQNKRVIQSVLEDSALDTMYKDKKRRDKLAKARELVTDVNFWEKLDTALSLLSPINKALAQFKNDDSFVSAVFHQFTLLSQNEAYHKELDNSVHQLRFLQQEILGIIANREAEFMTPSMKVGYLFDPNLDTSGLSDEEFDQTVANATAMITAGPEMYEKVSKQISDFAADKNAWSEETKRLYKPYTPLSWRSTRQTTYQLIAPLAKRLFCIPTSSAASERSWSIHGFIHSKRRNRLNATRAKKLVFVYTNHKGVDHVLYDSYPDAPRDDFDDVLSLECPQVTLSQVGAVTTPFFISTQNTADIIAVVTKNGAQIIRWIILLDMKTMPTTVSWSPVLKYHDLELTGYAFNDTFEYYAQWESDYSRQLSGLILGYDYVVVCKTNLAVKCSSCTCDDCLTIA